MVYFPESVVITTFDGIQFKSFSNEHPPGFIIAKPKYIPTETIFCDKLQLRSIFDKEVNRLNLWIDKEELHYYLQAFKENYPHYHFHSDLHNNWFFAIPEKAIKRIYDPKEGLKSLRSLPENEKDEHLRNVLEFVDFLLKSGIDEGDLGVTFSTVVGHYDKNYSDINIVIYGKENSWKTIKFLDKVKNDSLKWKTPQEWEDFRKKRNRENIFSREEFIEQMSRKRTEGFFNNQLFVLFPVEKEGDNLNKWGIETYTPLGITEIEATVIDNSHSLFRPGSFIVNDSKTLKGKNFPVSQVVFYSRDYVMQAFPKEKIKACGLLERVKNIKTGKEHYRVVVGYFDSYINERREQEFIKKIK